MDIADNDYMHVKGNNMNKGNNTLIGAETMKLDKLKTYDPCQEAVDWCETQTSWQAAWNNCERGDWMLWILGKLSGKPGSQKRKRLVLAVCECARLALKHVKKGETRPRKAIQTAEAWARNEGPTLDDVRADSAYAYAAAAAAYAADAAAAAAAADDAAYAAAYAAAAAADDAYAAADAYAYAAAADAYQEAKKKTLKKCAEIVRKHYPTAPRI